MHFAEKKKVIVHTSADGGAITSFLLRKRWLTTTPSLKQFINQIVNRTSLVLRMLSLVFASLHLEAHNCLSYLLRE